MPIGYKSCPRCGEEYRDDVEVCENCGWIFYNKSCPRCGKYVPDNAKVCFDCGWYFYWDEYIGEDDEEIFTDDYDFDEDYYDEIPEEEEGYDDYWDFWRETASFYVDDEYLEGLSPEKLGEILDDLGF